MSSRARGRIVSRSVASRNDRRGTGTFNSPRTLRAMQAWTIVLVAAAVAAVVDWWAVATERRSVEVWAKPLTMALLVGVAATAGDPDGAVRACLGVGAVLGLVGDIALMGDGETEFMVGLGSFAVGHLAY